MLLPKAPRPFFFFPLLPFSLLVLDGHFLGPCTRPSPYHNNPHLPATPASPRNSATPLAIGAVANDWLWRDRSGRLRSPHRFPISDATFFSRTCPRFDWRGSGKSGSDLQTLLLGAQCGFLRLESLTQVPRVSNARMRKIILNGCEFSHNTTSLVCDLSSRTTTSVKKLEIDFRSCRLWKALLLLINKCCCCALRVLRFSNFLVHKYVCV
jgi:hypothetical protein